MMRKAIRRSLYPFLLLSFFLVFPTVSFAISGPPVSPGPPQGETGNFVESVPDIDTKFSSLSKAFPSILGSDISQTTIVTLLNDLFLVLIAIGAILAILRIAMAGVKYMLSESFDTKAGAKKDLSKSVLGLVVMLAAVVVLNVINPTLTNLAIFDELSPTPPSERITADATRSEEAAAEVAAREACVCSGGVLIQGMCEEQAPLKPNEDLEPKIPSYCPNNNANNPNFDTEGFLPDVGAGGGKNAADQAGTANPNNQDDPSNPENRGR